MNRTWKLLKRGLILHCPVCGKGALFKRPFIMYEQCPVCHFTYEREEGYFSASMALNLVVSELIVAALAIPTAIYAGFHPGVSIVPFLLIGALLAIALPLLFFHHSRALWMSIDHLLNPAPRPWSELYDK